MRRIIDFNQDWTFIKGEERKQRDSHAAYPHTWNAKDRMDGGNDYSAEPAAILKIPAGLLPKRKVFQKYRQRR